MFQSLLIYHQEVIVFMLLLIGLQIKESIQLSLMEVLQKLILGNLFLVINTKISMIVLLNSVSQKAKLLKMKKLILFKAYIMILKAI